MVAFSRNSQRFILGIQQTGTSGGKTRESRHGQGGNTVHFRVAKEGRPDEQIPWNRWRRFRGGNGR